MASISSFRRHQYGNTDSSQTCTRMDYSRGLVDDCQLTTAGTDGPALSIRFPLKSCSERTCDHASSDINS
eukprot:16984-Eustigmatos_ZCMA.PRE.1